MKEETKPAGPVLALAVLGMLLLSGVPASTGAGPPTVVKFSDGSAGSTFYFGPSLEMNQTGFTMPRKAVVRSAELTVEGVAGLGGEYPAMPSLGLGAGGTAIWSFGAERPDAGEMGRQNFFPGGKDQLVVHFPGEGGASDEAGILLPTNATVRDASVEVAGAEGFHPPRTFSPPTNACLVAWNPLGGTLIQAFAGANSYVVSERDPLTGSERRRVELPFSAGEIPYLKDIRFMPSLDTVALLLPGRGVALLNLSSGGSRELFTGPDAPTLLAMKSGEGWLAVTGTGWAAVEDLENGSEQRFGIAEFPSSVLDRPAAVDYDFAGQRLFVAGVRSQAGLAVSVFHPDGRELDEYNESLPAGSLGDILFLPGRDTILVGSSSVYSGSPATVSYAVYSLSLADGTYLPVEAFRGSWGISSLRLDGDIVSALEPSNREIVLLDDLQWSWRTLPTSLPRQYGTGPWDYDAARQRLALAATGGELWVLEPDFPNSSGESWLLPPIDDSVPSSVNAAIPVGEDIVLGTDNGLMAIGPDGRLNWSVDCGMVQQMALDPASGRLTAASEEGLRLDAGSGQWQFSRLNVSVVDLSRSPPSSAWRAVGLPAEWAGAGLDAVAPVTVNGTVFFGLQDGSAGGLYGLSLSNGSIVAIETPSQYISSLASSPDGRTIYAGFSDSGLLALDTVSGKQQLLTPFSEVPLISPHVSSLAVDAEGDLLVGQSPFSGYFTGGVSLFSPAVNGTLNETFSYELGDGSAQAVARDIAGGRMFIGSQDGIAVIDEATGSRMDIEPGLAVASLSWAAGDRTLAGASFGSAFAIMWTGTLPGNISLDVGADGTIEWTDPGRLDWPVTVDMGPALAAALAARRPGARFTDVPLRVTAGSGGLVVLRSLAVSYELSEKVDFRDALSAYLAALPVSEEATVPLELTAQGGGLKLSDLNVTYEPAAPPRARSIPEIRVDTAAAKPTTVDLSRYFSDELTSPANLTYQISVQGSPSGVSMSLLFAHYLSIDGRNSTFRGVVTVTVTARNAEGLFISTDAHVKVERAGEYVPPPPFYNTMLWVFGAVMLVIGLLALRLYFRAYRRKE